MQSGCSPRVLWSPLHTWRPMALSTLLVFAFATCWLCRLLEISNIHTFESIIFIDIYVFLSFWIIRNLIIVQIFWVHSNKLLITNGVMWFVPFGFQKFHFKIQFSLNLSMDCAMCQKRDGIWNVTFVRNQAAELPSNAIKPIVIRPFMLLVLSMLVFIWSCE